METLTKPINNRTVRFSSAPWYSPGTAIFIGGAGGIGSWLALLLARQEAQLYIYDYDTIDETNMGGQLYGTHQISMTKAQAVQDNILNFCGRNYSELMGKYQEDSMTNPIMFSCFDNMAARKLMFEKWAKMVTTQQPSDLIDLGYPIFIDGRMLAEEGQVYYVTPDKIEQYRATLFDDSEAATENCSYKSTSYCGAFIASVMVAGFNNYMTNALTGNDMRDVPFSMQYQLPLLNFQLT